MRWVGKEGCSEGKATDLLSRWEMDKKNREGTEKAAETRRVRCTGSAVRDWSEGVERMFISSVGKGRG